MRTTVYLVGPALDVIERVRSEYARYGLAITVSAVFARLLLGESVDDVIARPFRTDLARIADQTDALREDLERARARRRAAELHRIHRDVAQLFPRLKQISNTLARSRRRSAPYSPDFTEAVRIEETLNELMTRCVEAIVPGRR